MSGPTAAQLVIAAALDGDATVHAAVRVGRRVLLPGGRFRARNRINRRTSVYRYCGRQGVTESGELYVYATDGRGHTHTIAADTITNLVRTPKGHR